MTLVQQYLLTHSLADLAREHGVYAGVAPKAPYKAAFNYDQIEARESDPLARQCRGLVLARVSGGGPIPFSLEDPGPVGETVVLARPMDRFFNHGQNNTDATQLLGKPGTRVFEKLDGCFGYNTSLQCWDGTTVLIGNVVRKRLKPVLIGRDAEGRAVPCEVIDWFDNGRKDEWIDIFFDRPPRGPNGSRIAASRLRVTPNHAIFVNGAFIPASSIRVGDIVAQPSPRLDARALHAVQSGLLGDGSICGNGNNYRYEESHKFEHDAYTNACGRWCGAVSTSRRLSGYGTQMRVVATRTLSSLQETRAAWYPNNGSKRVPSDLSWIDDFTVAKWYMDDGSLAHSETQRDRACFATNGFPREDVERLANRLEVMYGVECCVYDSRGWCIRVNAGRANAIANMWTAIAPHIVPVMRYKLPEAYRSAAYAPREDGAYVMGWIDRRVTAVEMVANLTKDEFPNGRRGFDISTTTTNYVANGILVHNSLAIVYFDDFAGRWCMGTRGVPEADKPIDGFGEHTFRTLFDHALREHLGLTLDRLAEVLRRDVTYCFELTTPHNRIVVEYDRPQVHLLAMRHRDGQEICPVEDHRHFFPYSVPRAPQHSCGTLAELIGLVTTRDPKASEGVVVRGADFTRIKVKSPAYVALSSLRGSVAGSPRRLLEVVLLGKDDDVLPMLAPEIQALGESYKRRYARFCESVDLTYESLFASTLGAANQRKEIALLCQQENIWIPPIMDRFQRKSANMKDFVERRRDVTGGWPDSFLDNLLNVLPKE